MRKIRIPNIVSVNFEENNQDTIIIDTERLVIHKWENLDLYKKIIPLVGKKVDMILERE